MFRQISERGCSIREHFNSKFPLINAITSGKQEGMIFVDREENIYCVIHKAGFLELHFENMYHALYKVFEFLKKTNEIPKYFHIYNPPESIVNFLNPKNEGLNVRIRKRVQLRLKEKIGLNLQLDLPAGYYIKRVAPDNFHKLSVFGLELDKKFWKSEEDFFQNSFGFCVFNNNDIPASICYAACIVDEIAEIDVATLPQFQKKGLAKISVTAFLKFCIENKITPNWDCFEENLASLQTALAIGFTPIQKYCFLSIYNKNKK
jgi:hypothetical protein